MYFRTFMFTFWRWGPRGRFFDAHPESPGGIVAFITTASLSQRPRICWYGASTYAAHRMRGGSLTLSPEGHRPDIGTRIFPTNQHPICIGVFCQGKVNHAPMLLRRSGTQQCRARKGRNLSGSRTFRSMMENGWSARTVGMKPFAPKLEDTWTSYPPSSGICFRGVHRV